MVVVYVRNTERNRRKKRKGSGLGSYTSEPELNLTFGNAAAYIM
jgi:hypothetical protein